jgi:integrase
MGSGSIFRRKADGRWIAQVSEGSRSSRCVRRKVARSRAEAKEHLAELLDEYGVKTSRTTVGDWLRSWLTGASRSLKASTVQTYEIAIRRQIVPSIGHVQLGRLTPSHVERLLGELALTMSPKGARNVLAVLARALTVAERQGLVHRNVARLVDRPRVARREVAALTVDDVRRILATVAGERLEALYVMALATGLRQAELLGLRWTDWDREAGTIRVAYALARIDGRYQLVEPKTRRSRRTVALPRFAAEALSRHRAAQVAERLAAGQGTEDGLIFVTREGRPLNAGTITHRWPTIARRAGVDCTFHGLRHGQASLLVALGLHPRVIAERLGHATTAMSMDVYAHVSAASDREAARLLDEAIGSRGTAG